MRVFGTVTSPFVRRIRVACAELAVPCELVDTNVPAGQAALRAASPLWKVPTAVLPDGRVLWDSTLILDDLFATHGTGPLRSSARAPSPQERAFIAAIDEALLALIRLFYLQKDGMDVSQAPFLVKERARVTSILSWADSVVRGPWCTDEDDLGRAELALYTSLAWMAFRSAHDLAPYRRLAAFMAAHDDRPSLASTRPPPA